MSAIDDDDDDDRTADESGGAVRRPLISNANVIAHGGGNVRVGNSRNGVYLRSLDQWLPWSSQASTITLVGALIILVIILILRRDDTADDSNAAPTDPNIRYAVSNDITDD